MDIDIKILFNDGDNNGNLLILCNDNIQIKCHSFILKTQSEFINTMFNFNNKNGNKTKTLDLNYPSIIVKIILNKMYDSQYIIPNINHEQILLAFEFMIIY